MVTTLGAHVIVKVIEKQKRTASGIFLSDTNRDLRPDQGIVIESKAGHLKEGDLVLFPKYAGTEIKVDDDILLVLHGDRDIYALLNY